VVRCSVSGGHFLATRALFNIRWSRAPRAATHLIRTLEGSCPGHGAAVATQTATDRPWLAAAAAAALSDAIPWTVAACHPIHPRRGEGPGLPRVRAPEMLLSWETDEGAEMPARSQALSVKPYQQWRKRPDWQDLILPPVQEQQQLCC